MQKDQRGETSSLQATKYNGARRPYRSARISTTESGSCTLLHGVANPTANSLTKYIPRHPPTRSATPRVSCCLHHAKSQRELAEYPLSLTLAPQLSHHNTEKPTVFSGPKVYGCLPKYDVPSPLAGDNFNFPPSEEIAP